MDASDVFMYLFIGIITLAMYTTAVGLLIYFISDYKHQLLIRITVLACIVVVLPIFMLHEALREAWKKRTHRTVIQSDSSNMFLSPKNKRIVS